MMLVFYWMHMVIVLKSKQVGELPLLMMQQDLFPWVLAEVQGDIVLSNN